MNVNVQQETSALGSSMGNPIDSPTENPYSYLDLPSSKEIFTSSHQPNEMKFYVEGVHCSRCLSKIEKASHSFPGLENIHFDMSRNILTSKLKADGSFAQLAQTISQLGFKVSPLKSQDQGLDQQKKANRRLLIQLAVAGACTGNIMLYSVSLYSGADGEVGRAFEWISFLLFLPVILFSAWPFYQTTWAALKNKKPSIDLPIVFALLLGTLLSFYHLLIGSGDIYFDSLASLVFLLLAARMTLRQIQQRYLSTSYLKSFLGESVARLWQKDLNKTLLVPIESLKPGDTILVLQNEKLPVDGWQLTTAPTLINPSILTGESYPKKNLENDKCYAGTQLLSEKLLLQVDQVGENTRMGQIFTQMEKELQSKTPLIQLTDRLAHYFVLSVILIGSLFFLYYFSIDMEEAIRRSLALVILACPCALALATPLTHSLGLSWAAKRGIYIKNANILEKLNQIQNIAFDKTGTLTQGQFQILRWLQDHEPTDLDLAILLELEKNSEHPVAQVFKKTYHQRVLPTVTIQNPREVVGEGVSGYYQKDFYEVKASPELGSQQIGTVVGLYKNHQLLYSVELGDYVFPDSAKTIHQLQQESHNVVLLSGDSPTSVRKVAQALGIPPSQAFAGQTPESKYQWILKHPQTMLVGDGANDSLAMASSFCGVAAKGSLESSLKACDVYLDNPGVGSVTELIHLSQETLKIIKRNLALSLFYNISAGAAALLGYVNPLVAAILMPVSSVTVLLSSIWGTQKLRKMRKKESPSS